MSTELTVRQLSRAVPMLRKNKPPSVSMEELQDMYASRCLMADFLSVKGIPIKCKKNPAAKLDGASFSRAYRRVAAEMGIRTAYVRSSTDNLLWDMDFLEDHLGVVKEQMIAEMKVDLFGNAD